MRVWGLLLLVILFEGCISTTAETEMPSQMTITTTTPPAITNTPAKITISATNQREILDISYKTFNSKFDGLTGIQEINLFDVEFKTKYVQWNCTLDDIDEVNSIYTMYLRCKPCTTISCYGDMTVTLKSDQKEKASALKKGETVEFTGRLSSRYSAEDGVIID